MVDSQVQPNCRLCGKAEKLRQSHLLPAALYKHLRHDSQGSMSRKEPFHLTSRTATRTSRQIKDYLLCDACEWRFSTFGEQWVLDHCFRKPGDFPLQQMLAGAPPQQELRHGSLIETSGLSGIDISKLAYFAISVIWRMAVHSWDVVKDQKPIRLGNVFEEKIRCYLLGKADLPVEVAILVKVASSQRPMTQSMSLATVVRRSPYHHYQFSIPGIVFEPLVGGHIPNVDREQGCIVRGRGNPVFLLRNDLLFESGVAKLLATAKPSKGLMKEFGPCK
jgi:hypothetical protein